MRLLTLLIVFAPLLAHAQLKFGGEGELYVPIPVQNSTTDGDRLRLRSVELTAQSPIEETLNGKLTLGANDVAGDMVFNIREAFITADIGSGFGVRAGKFYLPIGILNQERRSAWPFLSAPRALGLFFTDDGVVDTGVDISYVSEHFSMRVGATNGFRYDSGIQNGGTKPQTPTNFARPEVSFALGSTRATFALDYLGRVDDAGDTLRIAGVDGSLSNEKWNASMELYHRFQNPASQGLAIVENVGGYLFGEYSFGSVLGGLRFDVYKIPTLTNSSGDRRDNMTWAVSPVVTYLRPHLNLAAEYTYLKETRDGNSSRVEQVFELRLVTEFGDIPKFRTPLPDRSSL